MSVSAPSHPRIGEPPVIDTRHLSTTTANLPLRDHYAAVVLPAIAERYLKLNGFGGTWAMNVAGHAYKLADAMMAERRARL